MCLFNLCILQYRRVQTLALNNCSIYITPTHFTACKVIYIFLYLLQICTKKSNCKNDRFTRCIKITPNNMKEQKFHLSIFVDTLGYFSNTLQ